MKKIKNLTLIFSVLAMSLVGGMLPIVNESALATDLSFTKSLDDVASGTGMEKKENFQPTNVVTQALKILMYAVGVISVVMIIVGGIRYATSGGAAEKVKSAKNTILYACVGLAVALLSLALVSFINEKTKEIGSVGNLVATLSL